MRANLKLSFLATILLCWSPSAFAQNVPRLVSSVPANGLGGVATTSTVVFTFSEAMNPDATSAEFMNLSNVVEVIDWTESWNAQNTVLTCTPNPTWPDKATIMWFLSGENPSGTSLDELSSFGSFRTGEGSDNVGTGTNKFTSFSVGKSYLYQQTSTAAPVFDPDLSQLFVGSVSLSSNRTATAVTLKLPTGVVTNATPSITHPEDYAAMDFFTNQTVFEAKYPQGDYEFTVQAATSNQVVKVAMPANMQQPNAPHVSNFDATQVIDPTKDFVLVWDAFQGGTANDYIYVSVGDLYQTGDLGETNTLSGTATSVTIPANTLAANTTNHTAIEFWRYVVTTNSAQAYSTLAYRQSITHLNLITTAGGTTVELVIEKPKVEGNQFVFETATSPGQIITLQAITTLQPNSWQTVYTTNAQGTRVRFSLPVTSQPGATLYRLKNGS